MSSHRQNRRAFLKTSAATVAATSIPWWIPTQSAHALNYKGVNDRPIIGCIGTGDRWKAVGAEAMKFGDVVAVCDVDSEHAAFGKQKVIDTQGKNGRPTEIGVYEDYRKILERPDIEAVTIVTPDHWHTKIAIEAMKAGKDVYCEKPLTLTIDEGKQIVKVLDETKRVFQVGTQQRSEMGSRFLQAIAIIRDGRIGKIKKVQCAIGDAPKGGPFPTAPVPSNLNWDMWLGQAPLTDYIQKRCHYEFRWWYEYSGGKMTDWGAHHVDIAQWAIGMDNTGPLSVEGTAEHPCDMKNGFPACTDKYNVAYKFNVVCMFPGGLEMVIRNDTDNGILFEGETGKLFVNRSKIAGKVVDELKEKPLPEDAIAKVYRGKMPAKESAHMANFFDCIKSRELPISDVYTHHRAMTTCHLANISIRLGRKVNWNPETQQIENDKEAQSFQSREQRKGYEIVV